MGLVKTRWPAGAGMTPPAKKGASAPPLHLYARGGNLAANCIPEGVVNWDSSNYEGFLAQRRLLVAAKIRKYYESL